MKQQKDINLVDILNYNGTFQEREKKINQLLYFPLIIEKNIMLEIIILLFALQIIVPGLEIEVSQKYI